MSTEKIFNAEWFPYYFERFEASDRVAVMSLAEEGAYHRAIRIAWKLGYVPADPKVLAAKIQKHCSVKVAAAVLKMFDPMPGNPDRMIHPTVEQIRAEQKEKYEKYRQGGLKTAEKRWGNREKKEALDKSATNSVIAKLQPSDSLSNSPDVADKRKETKDDSSKEESSGRERRTVVAPPRAPTYKANHPALVAIRTITGHQPDPATFDNLIDVLGKDPDILRLTKCYSEWVTRGYKKANFAWITEWYVNGIPQRKNNGTNQVNDGSLTHDQRVLADSADFYRNYDDPQHPA